MAGALPLAMQGAPGDVIAPGGAPMDPAYGVLGNIMAGAPPLGPVAPSPLTTLLTNASQQAMPSGEQMTGALSRAQSARDQAAQDKMAAITRAMNVLQNIPQQGGNLPQIAFGAGLMRPGPITSEMSDAGMAYANAVGQQREAARQNAFDIANLSLQKAGIPAEVAQQGLEDIYGRYKFGLQAAQDAALSQYRDTTGQARMMSPYMGMMGRIGAAEINSNKNRYQYLGPSQDDPTQGIYLDRTTGQSVNGPGVAPKQTAFGQKYSLAQELYPGDPQKAFLAASGKIAPNAQQLQQAADKFATEQLDTLVRSGNPPDDAQAFVRDTAKQYVDRWHAADTAPAPAAAPHAAAPQHGTQPQANQQDLVRQQSLSNARAAIQRGADRGQVIQRLKQAGIDPTGL